MRRARDPACFLKHNGAGSASSETLSTAPPQPMSASASASASAKIRTEHYCASLMLAGHPLALQRRKLVRVDTTVIVGSGA